MRSSWISSSLVLFALAPFAFTQSASVVKACDQSSTATKCLLQVLKTPPDQARPMMRWWWFGVAVDKHEILRELKQMRADGIGGVELAFVYPQVVNDPAKELHNDPFVGPEMLENVRYAQEEARRLGIRVDVTLGSGWPYGGPATTSEEAAHSLRVAEIPLPPNALELPKLKLQADESIVSISIVNGAPQHWDPNTSVHIDKASGKPLPASSEQRTVLFFIDSRTKQIVKRAAVGAEGWVLDPFQRKAIDTHLKSVGEPLLSAFADRPPYAIFSDSLEAYGADWTPALPQEFKRRRGYDLLPRLPELVAGGTQKSANLRHDWGKTLTELVEENYLTPLTEWAADHHTKFRSQTYGEPAVTLSSQRLVDLPEGEGPYWRQFNTLRWATSGNHLYGRNVTSAETFTWLHSPVFRATPLDMKAEADLHFIIGTNQIIGHGWPYSAPQVGEPGWSLYAAAVFNDHNPWHPVMPQVSSYIQRVSALLRMGKPANQVALLLPVDDAWANFVPGHVSVTAMLAKTLSPSLITAILDSGYNFDFIDAEAIKRLGIPYSLLVLPPTDRISLETLQAIGRYVARGGKVISVGHAPTVTPDGKNSAELTRLSTSLFSKSKHSLVDADSDLGAALQKAATPDFEVTEAKEEIGFIRRKLATADIYFVANTSNHPVHTSATLASRFLKTVVVDPTSGETTEGTKEHLPLDLAPYESRIIFISKDATSYLPSKAPSRELLDLSKDWTVEFTGIRQTKSMQNLTDWIADPEIRNYSGEAIYRRTFSLRESTAKPVYLSVAGGHATTSSAPKGHPGMQAWYEGPVREAALVVINGQAAGALWHPPYRLDITRFLKSGENRVELHVFNTALNAWSALPPRDYKPLLEQYGDRFQMQDLDKVKPISSGIEGTIQLVTTP